MSSQELTLDVNSREARWLRRGAWALPALYFVFFVMGFPVVNISRGHTGIDLFYGKAYATREAGWSLRLPLVEVIEVSNQARTTVVKESDNATQDLQMAKIDINSSWSILPADMLATYNAFGDQDDIEQTLIQPGLVEVLKSMSAKYDAYQLQQKAAVIAEESRLEMGTWLKESFALRGLTSRVDVATVLYPHVDFSPEFKAATSEQTTTEQSIGTFENERTRAVTEAQGRKDAKIREANAQAYSIRASADAETSGIIAKSKSLKANPKLLCYMVHKGWNGKLPEVNGGESPLPFAEVCN